ncbi:hypothetical protein CSAL01_06122 [Colletotrichum salicis]|uniref:Uncharacterized protein n=1 Tax=Colletotrichum salicis TaxID=1209931 RepID=A0A135U927_9PEZI|nr:hypothetical protein CSAL01_06122 [Colletotrichum salicis]
MDAGRHNVQAVNPEAPSLHRERLSRFLNDKDGPITLSVVAPDTSERKRRAQAEIDGIFAGLTYLDKLKERQDPPDAILQPQERILDKDLVLDDIGRRSGGQGSSSNSTAQPRHTQSSTDKIQQAWIDLRGLRKGVESQYERLQSIASSSSSESVRGLPDIYDNARGMGKMGILAHRDALDFVIPDTLAEIVAFTSVSYLITNILLQRGRIIETNPLIDLQRWGDCIPDIDNRNAFASFALEMWPSDHPRAITNEGEGGHDDKASHRSGRKQHASIGGMIPGPQLPHPQSTQQEDPQGSFPGGFPNPSTPPWQEQEISQGSPSFLTLGPSPPHELDLEWLKSLYSTDTASFFEEDPSHLEQSNYPAGGLESNFCDSFSASGVDLRDLETSPSGLSLGHLAPRTLLAISGPPMSASLPPAVQDASAGLNVEGDNIDFANTKHYSSNLGVNPGYASMVSAVLAFSQDIGDFFYRLSGCGKTVRGSRRGSAYASQRSKAEKRLRKEVLDPMKKSWSGNAVFLALLSVAKSFVVLGSLGTLEDVQDYLVAISREIIEPGHGHESFVRLIHRSTRDHPQGTKAPIQSNTDMTEEQPSLLAHQR